MAAAVRDYHGLSATHIVRARSALLLIIDRTNWKLGRTEINVLVLAVAYRGVAVPLFWQVLNREGVGKAGNSHSRERIALMTDAIRLLSPEQIQGVLADREFIGKTWFEWLIRQRIDFYIRIRKNTLVQYPEWMNRRHLGIGPIPEVPIGRLLNGLRPGEIRFVGGRRRKASYRVFGQSLYLIGLKCASDDVLIATNAEPEQALSLYRQRWEIECLFKAIRLGITQLR